MAEIPFNAEIAERFGSAIAAWKAGAEPAP